jgi:beta-lactamase superfamily II metal-dependent hydrolase
MWSPKQNANGARNQEMLMKLRLITLGSCVVLATGVLLGQSGPAAKLVEIYVIDVEGGKADLIVAPDGQTALIDTGGGGSAAAVQRDVDRIMEVAGIAGVTKLDYLLTTHYHVDHVGGLQELVKRLPVTTYLDHGPTAEEREQVAGFQAAYAQLHAAARHQVLKVGDRIPIPGMDWRVVTSDGEVQKTPVPGAQGAGPNPHCAGVTRSTLSNGGEENARSVGSLITIGAFRLVDFGDLTGEREFDLMCPNNPIGTVDLFMASNHGTNNANMPFFIHSLAPRVSIAQNNPGKGASLQYLQALYSTPGFEDVWLVHWANVGLAEWNPPGAFIANGVEPETIAAALTAPARGAGGRRGRGAAPAAGTPGTGPAQAPQAQAAPAAPAPGAQAAGAAQAPGAAGAPGGGRAGGGAAGGRGGGQPPHTPAHYLKVSIQPDGTFTVLNSRNNFSRTYAPRPR